MSLTAIRLLSDPTENEVALWKMILGVRRDVFGQFGPLAGGVLAGPDGTNPTDPLTTSCKNPVLVLGNYGQVAVAPNDLLNVNTAANRVGVGTCSPIVGKLHVLGKRIVPAGESFNFIDNFNRVDNNIVNASTPGFQEVEENNFGQGQNDALSVSSNKLRMRVSANDSAGNRAGVAIKRLASSETLTRTQSVQLKFVSSSFPSPGAGITRFIQHGPGVRIGISDPILYSGYFAYYKIGYDGAGNPLTPTIVLMKRTLSPLVETTLASVSKTLVNGDVLSITVDDSNNLTVSVNGATIIGPTAGGSDPAAALNPPGFAMNNAADKPDLVIETFWDDFKSGSAFGLTLLNQPVPHVTVVDRIATSGDGTYAIAADASTANAYLYKRGAADDYSQTPSQPVLAGASISGVTISKDGVYIAIAYTGGDGNKVALYKNSGGSLTVLPLLTPLPLGNMNGVAISANNRFLAVAYSDALPTLEVYERSGDSFIRLPNNIDLNPDGLGGSDDVSFSANGDWLVVDRGASVSFYQFNPDPLLYRFERKFTASPGGDVLSHSTDTDATYTVVRHNAAAIITVYKRSGDTFTAMTSQFNSLPSSSALPGSIAISQDARYVALGSTNTPRLWVYKRDGDNFEKINDAATIPSTDVDAVAISNDGLYIPIAMTLTGTVRGIQVYKLSGTETVAGIAIYSDGALRLEDTTLRGDLESLKVRNKADTAYADLFAAKIKSEVAISGVAESIAMLEAL